MKKVIYIILIGFITISCIDGSDDLNRQGYNYTVIDTTHVSENGLGVITSYDVIIEEDSTLYSATMSTNGIVYRLDRKLKIKK